jgi:hypothetical protein
MVQKMTPRFPLSAIGLAAALVAANAVHTPAAAQLVVLESSATTIKAGVRFEDSDRVSIPSGSHIRVVLPSGKTRTLRGPYEGTVAELTKGEPRNEGVMAWLKDFLRTGGARESTPGATRGLTVEAKPIGFSWSAVPATANGTVCVHKGARLELVRAASSRAERVVVVDAASSARGESEWQAGSATTSWPADLAPRAGGVYYVLLPNRPQRQITLRVLDRLPADDDVLAELHRHGCRQQFEAWARKPVASR